MVDNTQQTNKKIPQELKTIEWITRFMDYGFRFPGTDIRFGLDFILGFLPVVGDAISLSISGLLLISMIRYGVQPGVIFRMLGNILLDALVGSIPVLGNIFDLTFKANKRNFILLQAHQVHGKKYNMPWKWIIGVGASIFITLIGMMIGFLYLIIWLVSLF